MSDKILRVENLTKIFAAGEGLRRGRAAVDGLSFSIREGSSLGIVGESGCGKTTAARMIAGLEPATEGSIRLKISPDTEVDLCRVKGRARRGIYRYIQMVFQNPQASFDPRQNLGKGICESLRNSGMTRKEAMARAQDLILACGLPRDILEKYPHEVSGGQCQRAAIARAAAIRPRLLLLDEPTSALDVTVQKQIFELLKEFQKKFGMSFLFITHDLAAAQEMCDRILVMKDGKKVEENSAEELIRRPRNPYTRLLMESIL